MSDNLLTRLNRIASEILPGQQIETTARGEDYYLFKITRDHDRRFRPLVIDPKASGRQVKDKLRRDFEQAFHPDSGPDDLPVPNLQTEANQPKIAEESVKPSQLF